MLAELPVQWNGVRIRYCSHCLGHAFITWWTIDRPWPSCWYV